MARSSIQLPIVTATLPTARCSSAISRKLVLDNASILQGIVHVGCGGEIDTISGTNNTINTANGPTHNTTVPSLIIDEGGSVAVNDNSSLALASPYNIENNGTIELKSTGHDTIFISASPTYSRGQW